MTKLKATGTAAALDELAAILAPYIVKASELYPTAKPGIYRRYYSLQCPADGGII